MHPDIQTVIDLQATDREIARLSAEIAYLPKHIKEIESKLAGTQGRLEADKQSLIENQKERKKLEGEVTKIQDKASKFKGQIFEVKTNEQYKALQHEIEFCEKEVRGIEDKILERMVAAEELDARVKKAEKTLAAERTEVEKEKAEATARTRVDQEKLDRLQRERDEYRRKLPSDVVQNYDGIARTRKGIAVSEVREGTCMECRVRLRPQAYQEAKTNDRIRYCENCTRILYYVAPPVPGETAEASAATPPA